jgi:hypothetical protein
MQGWTLLFGIGFVLGGWLGFWTDRADASETRGGGAYIGTDERSGDSVIRVGPAGETGAGTRMYMDRDPGTGDRVIHVVPAPEQDRNSEVIFGPVWIAPEVPLPGPRSPKSWEHPGRAKDTPDSRVSGRPDSGTLE